MALETGTYISDLVITNPVIGDDVGQGDDHLRLVKATVKTTFPNVTGAVTPTHTQLNFVSGVTSALQTQIDAKAPLASPALTGTPTVPTATAGTNTTQIASTAFVTGEALGAWKLITSTAAAAVATVDFTGLSSTYDVYMLEITGLSSFVATQLYLRTSTNNGTSYDAGATDYKYAYGGGNTSGVFAGYGSAGIAQIVVSNDLVGATTDPVHVVLWLFRPWAVAKTTVTWISSGTDGSVSRNGAGARQSNTGAVNAIRFLAGSGTMTGTFNLFGRRK